MAYEFDTEVQNAIMTQVKREMSNALAYLAAYSALLATGWKGFAKEAKADAEAEFGHAQAFIEYATRRGYALPVVEAEPATPPEGAVLPVAFVIEAAGLEATTSAEMEKLIAAARAVQDDETVTFVSDRLLAQRKEEFAARSFAIRISECGAEGLVLIDRELGG